MEKLYKVLDKNGHSCHGGNMQWSLPTKNDDGTWTPGEWMPEIKGEIIPCENGYHLCREKDLTQWLRDTVWIAEVDGEIVEADDKVVCRRVRLISGTAWNERNARLFACDCAEHVLHLYEHAYPGDDRPRLAIETARAYANGKATEDELSAARDAARAAAMAAAMAAAAWAAARVAAWDSAWADQVRHLLKMIEGE